MNNETIPKEILELPDPVTYGVYQFNNRLFWFSPNGIHEMPDRVPVDSEIKPQLVGIAMPEGEQENHR